MTYGMKFRIVAAARIWNLASGLCLIAVAAFLFSPVEQGYFYTFLSLGAAQYFCDLGVGFVLGNIAGRRTAGDIEGRPFEPEALRSMRQVMRFALRWSLASGAVLIVILGLLGARIFWGTETNGTPVTQVWLVYAVLAAYTMALHMILRIVEAVGFVVEAALTRSVQSFINIVFLAAFAAMGFGMWSVVIGLSVALGTATLFFWSLSAKLRSAFGRPDPGGETIMWRRDILPFQSRVAASWIGSYGIFQAQVPFLFAFAGPVAAGQFGMAMQIFQALNTTGNIFLTFSVKRWTTLAMQADWTELLADFRRILAASTGLMVAGGILILGLAYALGLWDVAVIDRLPPLLLLALYAVAACGNQVFFAWGYLFRAREEDPFWPLSLIMAAIIILVPVTLGEGYTLEIAIYSFAAVSLIGLWIMSSVQALWLIRRWRD